MTRQASGPPSTTPCVVALDMVLNPPVPHAYDLVTERGGLGVMRRHQNCGAEIAANPAEQLMNAVTRGRVQVARRFVREKQTRRLRQSPSDRNSLLLAAGELMRKPPCQLGDIHPGKPFHGGLSHIRPARQLQRNLYVFDDG